jgi:hypothetical protein
MKKSALKLLVFIRLESNPLEQRVGVPDATVPAFGQAIDRVQLAYKNLKCEPFSILGEFIIDRQGEQISTLANPCRNRVLRLL